MLFFGDPQIDGDGLMPGSDSGVAGHPGTLTDGITMITAPEFWGLAEANALVTLYADLNDNGQVDAADVKLGEGVAIPHGKMPGLARLVASFARSRAGVDFESIDGQATHLFFLLVVPEHSGGQHLKALARISRFFRDAEFRQKLAEAEALEDIFAAIEQEDAKF